MVNEERDLVDASDEENNSSEFAQSFFQIHSPEVHHEEYVGNIYIAFS